MRPINPHKVQAAGLRHQYVLMSSPLFRVLGMKKRENHRRFGLRTGCGLARIPKWIFRGL